MPSIKRHSRLAIPFIVALMQCTVSFFPAFAETVRVDGITYAINRIDDDYTNVHKDIPDGEAIVWTLPDKTTELTIPACITANDKKYSVKTVAYASGVSIYSYGRDIENVIIQEGIQTLERNSFYGCRKLKKISIPASCTSIHEGAIPTFDSSGLSRYYDLNLEEIEVAKDNPVYATIDGVLYNKETKSLVVYPARKKDKQYVIPEWVESIETPIGGIDCLEHVVFPKNLKKIETVFFNGHSSMTITVPKEIGRTYEGHFFWDMYRKGSIAVFPNPHGDDIGLTRGKFKVVKEIPAIHELDTYVLADELDKANSGDYVAQFIVSRIYHEERNITESVKFLGLSAMHGFIPALFYLGDAYQKGEGVTQDYSGASFFYDLAASNSYTDAYVPAAECLFSGTGCDKDEWQGKKYIYEAAKKNNPRALFYVGKWTYYGEQWNRYGEKLFTEDKVQGLEILKQSASLQDELACFLLGQIYEDQKDIDTAKGFYKKAAENGYDLPADKADVLRKEN